MTRFILPLIFVCLATGTLFSAEKPNWTFTAEQQRLFNPPLDADAEKMLEWTDLLERPIPKDTEAWGGHDKYREQVQLMRIMVSRAILATDPPLELEKMAWRSLWFPYFLLAKQNPDEWLPKLKAVYNELSALSLKKGEVFDEQTVLYLSTRREFLSDGDFLSDTAKRDKDFLAYGEKLLDEVGKLMQKNHRFDNLERELYRIKNDVYRGMSAVDEKYIKLQADFKAEMKKLVIQNEDCILSPWWYELLLPEAPFDAPEKRAEADRLIEKFQQLLDTNEETKRFDTEPTDSIGWLYRFQVSLFENLVEADTANIPRLLAHLEALEKKSDTWFDFVFFVGYSTIWSKKLRVFSQNGGGSNDDLTLSFDMAMKSLDVSTDNFYNVTGYRLYMFLNSESLFLKCTPQQQELFKNRLEQVIAKMEVVEKAWKDAGKGMIVEESYVAPLQKHLDFLRMPGTVVALTGKTVDGTPFDIKEYRGKVVVLHFWATWCGPCIRRIPLMKELHAQYHDRGFEVLGISYDFEPEKIQPFIDKHKLPYLSLFDKDREILSRFSHGNSDDECLFDREGKVVFYKTDDELKEKLKKLFPE